jgi:hypothetical protein
LLECGQHIASFLVSVHLLLQIVSVSQQLSLEKPAQFFAVNLIYILKAISQSGDVDGVPYPFEKL